MLLVRGGARSCSGAGIGSAGGAPAGAHGVTDDRPTACYARALSVRRARDGGVSVMGWLTARGGAATMTAAVLALPAAAALACAPSPLEAGEAFLRAVTRCDFPAAWRMLAASERAAFDGGMAAWSQAQARKAAETFACRALVEDVQAESTPDPARVAVRYTLAEPAVVESFRRLLGERESAPVREWEALDRMIRDARGRMLLMDAWEPRIRSARVVMAEQQEGAEPHAWCVVAGYAAEAEADRAEIARMDAETARLDAEARQRDAARAQREAQNAEALRRGEAARHMIAAEAVRVGETVLREPGVWGEIVNRSPETLRAVRIRVHYLDAAGAVVGQREYSPILHVADEIAHVRRPEDAPLPPGQRRRFGVRAEDAPSTWSRRVRVEVIRVEADPTRPPAEAPAPAAAGARRPAR